ncbi:MAG: glycosyltransferase family 2 protein [Bacteroidales bacterium]|nr:glycosyltransferase family 2 protein [Bacteroidales bacterium]
MISVIIPNYNCADYLVRSVSSALHQTFYDLEVIVVDDGSTDDSLSLLSPLASDARLRIIPTPNRGVAAARNRGLDEAKGDFILFLDADDALHPDALRLLHEALIATKADAVQSLHSKIPQTKLDSTPPISPSALSTPRLSLYSPEDFVESLLYQTGLPDHSPWGKLFRKSLFDNARFSPGIIYEDLDLIPRILLRASSIALVHSPLYLYTLRSTSLIHSIDVAKGDSLRATRRLHADFAAISPRLERAAADRRLSASFNIIRLFGLRPKGRFSPDERALIRDFLEQARLNIRNLRAASLHNPKARLRNRVAALLSYLFL